MAFDMYIGAKHEQIGNHEEAIFYVVSDGADFPKLNWLWENYYKSPRISPHEANLLVHELISFYASNSDKTIKNLIDRLLPFFSHSYISSEHIECASD